MVEQSDIKADRAIGAMLGAASGDALGWPFEFPGRTALKMPMSGVGGLSFQKWERFSGGRFQQYKEVIGAGEYSDDTQMILCLSRALLTGDKWMSRMARVEIPFWTCYERGGGGATKRAAESWINAIPPWDQARPSREKYFDAGGNGVAMRILPHVLWNHKEEKFSSIYNAVLCDGALTHGHPRALVGSLCLGYVLWCAMRRSGVLNLGQLIEAAIDEEKEWGVFQPVGKCELINWSTWADRAPYDFAASWASTAAEMRSILVLCKREVAKGSLAIDDDLLGEIGAIKSKQSGSGTICAAAAIYLASRYASTPEHGIAKAASTSGSDTDTIACMTGAILGAINGFEWLGSLARVVQDASLLSRTATMLMTRESGLEISSVASISRGDIKHFIADCRSSAESGKIKCPDGRSAQVYSHLKTNSRSGTFSVELRRVALADGQTIYVHAMNKKTQETYPSERIDFGAVAPANQIKEPRKSVIGFRVPVSSLDKSVLFYRDLIGLNCKKIAETAAYFDGGLVLRRMPYPVGIEFKSSAIIYVQVDNWDQRLAAVRSAGYPIVSEPEKWKGSAGQSKYFRCQDPDGNLLEVFDIPSENIE